jgi:hypothetical protein
MNDIFSLYCWAVFSYLLYVTGVADIMEHFCISFYFEGEGENSYHAWFRPELMGNLILRQIQRIKVILTNSINSEKTTNKSEVIIFVRSLPN